MSVGGNMYVLFEALSVFSLHFILNENLLVPKYMPFI